MNAHGGMLMTSRTWPGARRWRKTTTPGG
jgi:hypothetical protein